MADKIFALIAYCCPEERFTEEILLKNVLNRADQKETSMRLKKLNKKTCIDQHNKTKVCFLWIIGTEGK